MQCKKCGAELTPNSRFCFSCGTKVEKTEEQANQEATKNVQNQSIEAGVKVEEKKEAKKQKTSDEDWPLYTGDIYRNRLVKGVRLQGIVYGWTGLAAIISAWKYHRIYGLGIMVLALFLSAGVGELFYTILGYEKYFGQKRLQQYDKLVETVGKEEAIATLENRKGGIIRIILIVIATASMLMITKYTCAVIAGIYMELHPDKFSTANTSSDGEITENVEDNQDEESAMQRASSNFQIGETVNTNKFAFTVTNAYVVDDLGAAKDIPEGAVYVVVEYEYKNISKKPISSWSLPTVKLEDGNGALYDQDVSADWYFDQYSDAKILSDLNPGIKTKDGKIFEVAIDVLNEGGMRAYVKADGAFEVDLPLSYENNYDTSYLEIVPNKTSENEYIEPNDENVEGDPGYGYVIEGSDSRYLNKDELMYMSKDELRLARNEIYARHGRLFDSADLQDYFNSMDWYYGYIPANQFDESQLNDYERQNLILIKEVENMK